MSLLGAWLIHRLEHLSTAYQIAGYGIKHTVDVSATLRSGIKFSELHVFVYGDAHGDVGECKHLGDGNLHNHYVHICQTREVPVARCLAHVALILLRIQYSGAEKLAGEVSVFLVLVFRQQLLLLLVFRVEALDCLQNEGVNYFLVVVPIKTFLLQQ